MHLIRRKWDRIAMKSVHKVVNEFNEQLQSYKNSSLSKVYTTFRSPIIKDEADAKNHSDGVQTQFHLEPDFDYVMYAKAVLQELVVDLANIQVSWLGICAFCVMAYFATEAIDGALVVYLVRERGRGLHTTPAPVACWGRRRRWSL